MPPTPPMGSFGVSPIGTTPLSPSPSAFSLPEHHSFSSNLVDPSAPPPSLLYSGPRCVTVWGSFHSINAMWPRDEVGDAFDA